MDIIKEKFSNIFYNSELGFQILEKLLMIILIIVIASISVKLCNKLVDYIMLTKDNANKKFKIKSNEKRSETLHKLIRSAVRYTIYFIAFFQILSTLGINTTSIVASAGIASVAIGFGAQSLVKDIISGFFIILEGQFDVGDEVKLYNQAAFIAGGSVMSLGLRSTKIRSGNGEIYFIPNGSINQVINYSLTYNLAEVKFSIQIDETIEAIEERIQKVLDVAVDMRRSSPTFGKYVAVELSEENKRQLFVPRGFAHGFLVLSPEAIFNYKVDNGYSPQDEVCIRWNDETLGIKWPIEYDKIITSPKDLKGKSLNEVEGF